MGTVHSLDEYRRKKEEEEEAKIALELHNILESFIDGIGNEPLIVSYEDSSGTHYYDLNNFQDITISDSNPYKK